METISTKMSAIVEKYEKAKERLIEATWRAIVGSAEVKAEDGELFIQENRMIQYGLCNIYTFVFKGSPEAVLIQTLPDYTWIAKSENKELIEKIMQEYEKISVSTIGAQN